MKGLSMNRHIPSLAAFSLYRWTILLLALLTVHSAIHSQQAPTAVLFKNVRIFDGNSAQLTPPSNLLVVGDTIAQISTSPIEPPSGVPTITIIGDGRVLIPGLLDAHWHSISAGANSADRNGDFGYRYLLAGVEAKQTLLRGFTTVRDLAGPSFGLKKAIDNGLIQGPRIYPSGAMISQTGGHGDNRQLTDAHPRFGGNTPRSEIVGDSIIADGRDQVLAAVREQLRLGASQIKLATTGGISSENDPLDSLQFTSDEIRAAVEAASDWGTYVTVHNYSSEGARRAIDAGVKVIDHGQLLDEPTIQLLAEKGIWLSIQPFLPTTDKSKLPADFASGPKFAKGQLVTAGTDRAYTLAKKYHVKIAFGTDLGGGLELAAQQNARLLSLTRWFSPEEILHIATAANGELVALSGPRNPYPKKLGVVETGAYADLLLVNGNPLEDINLLGAPDKSLAVIVKNGEIVKNTLGR
jgi:imidazolonepropionase-like amidohydrolase